MLVALINREIGQEGFQKVAGNVTDTIFRDAVNIELDLFKVGKTGFSIFRHA